VLMVQGRNDPQVPSSQAEQMFYRLRGKGVDVGYLLASDEGHEFRRQADRDAYYGAFAQFLITLSK
jgi:dipeptidyl aminopeptidase/acylaminoacyl peptidase